MENINDKCKFGSIFGTDFHLNKNCNYCSEKDECKKQHNHTARKLKELKRPAIPERLIIHYGLMINELDFVDRAILSLVYYRYMGKNDGICFDKNITFSIIAGVSKSTISRRLDNSKLSLITRGFLKSKIETHRKGLVQPKKGEPVTYRSSRQLFLTEKTLRLINMFKEFKEGEKVAE